MTRENTEWEKIKKKNKENFSYIEDKNKKMEDGRRQGTVTGVFYGHSTQATGTFITWTESIITYTRTNTHTAMGCNLFVSTN